MNGTPDASTLAAEETEHAPGPQRKKKTAKERKRESSVAIARLLDASRNEGALPATESQQVKFFREWEKSEQTIVAARQMLKDALKRRDDAVTVIVKRMGPGPYRWREKLYSASTNGDTVYLRELVARPRD
jgi:hypothetical protein